MSPSEYLPNQDRFCRKESAGTPLLAAIEELCRQTEQTLDDMEQRTLGEISALATAHYGSQLPEFWRIWNDWNLPDQEQSMGQL